MGQLKNFLLYKPIKNGGITVWSALVIGNWYMGYISWHLLAAAAIDLTFAAFFVAFLRRN